MSEILIIDEAPGFEEFKFTELDFEILKIIRPNVKFVVGGKDVRKA